MPKTTVKSRIVYNNPSLGSFDIPGVVYRGEAGTYRLFEDMTPSMNQDKLAKLYEREKIAGNPHPIDAPLLWAIATSGYELRNESPNDSERLREFLKAGFRRYPNTLTRVIYNPSRKEEVIHNYGTSDAYSIAGKVVGVDAEVTQIPDKKVLELLLGTKNTKRINQISQWVNNTDFYIWRENSRSPEKIERVARFGADDDRLNLGCYRNLLNEYPAFRVLRID